MMRDSEVTESSMILMIMITPPSATAEPVLVHMRVVHGSAFSAD